MVFATPMAAYVLSSSPSDSMSESKSAPFGAFSSCARLSRARRRYESHCAVRMSASINPETMIAAYQACGELCRDREQLVLELFYHGLHAAVQDVEIGFI